MNKINRGQSQFEAKRVDNQFADDAMLWRAFVERWDADRICKELGYSATMATRIQNGGLPRLKRLRLRSVNRFEMWGNE